MTDQPAPEQRPGLLDHVGAWIDSAALALSPKWAASREHYRRVHAAYEAAKPSTLRKGRREAASGDGATLRAGRSLREQARHLEQNHDLARGALAVLVANIAGGHGIGIEPQPCNKDGTINLEVADQLRKLHRDWERKKPEVTGTFRWAGAQRLAARSWVRDGEFLYQDLIGNIQGLNHRSKVPYSIELIESDLLPFELNASGDPWITMGVERNAWGERVAYHLYKQHPGDWLAVNLWSIAPGSTGIRRVSADRMHLVGLFDRIRQCRGVSIFASVLTRLDDLKDYEESERIAAKVAASMAAYIKKGRPEEYASHKGEDSPHRALKFRPGMIFDDLLPGEEIGTIDTSRPNTNLAEHRNGQLRAVASGVNTSFSSLSKAYLGSYSSQRQELVETWNNYLVLQEEFTAQFVAPVYETFVAAALAAGLLRLPSTIDLDTLDDALYIGPQMPWIDPGKESQAWERLERNGHASGPEIIRRRGESPDDVLRQEHTWRQRWKQMAMVNAADPANNAAPIPHDNTPVNNND